MEPPRNKVLDSIENPYGDLCVDLFARSDGTFGFEEYRRDPEDNARWHCLHRHQERIFRSLEDARAQARSAVAWLSQGERT